MEEATEIRDLCDEYLINSGCYQGLTAANNGGYVLSVVDMSNGIREPFQPLDNVQFMPESHPNFINLKIERSPTQDIFNPDGTLRILGYGDTSAGLQPPNLSTNHPGKSKGHAAGFPAGSSSPTPCGSGAVGRDEFIASEEDYELLDVPLYVLIYKEKEKTSTRRRSTKIPQALPLQKVSKRRTSENDQTSCYMEEQDGEVVVLMNGVLTKVGKPSVPASSGKIYSTAQNCPITVKWLLENFESMVGQSLPRSFVYDQYVAHCGLNKIDAVNAASFGKLIRSVFLGLRTRRLGTRGNSKYHYYGIKIKEISHLLPILNSIRAEQDLLNDTVNGRIRKRVRRTQSVYTGKHVKGLVIDKKVEIQENLGSFEYNYPDISIGTTGALPDGIDESSIDIFEDTYKRHCMRLVQYFHEFKLIDVLAELANFWRLSLTFKRKGLEDYNSSISKPLLFKLTSLEIVETFLVRMDLYTFQHIINILIPSILRPLPLQMLQAIDNMIHDVLSVISIALNGFPQRIVHSKLRTLTAFVRIWKQYSKMSQLSEFVELTLENDCSVQTMREDVKSIKLSLICERAAMIVESKTMTSERVFKMMLSFIDNLEKEQSLDLWCEWSNAALLSIASSAVDGSIKNVEFVTADLHSSWLITSNLVVNAIREIYGSESSLFIPLLQWCGELMQYYRQRLLDEMKEILPVTRFYIALEDEDMSVSFMDKQKAKQIAVLLQPEEDIFSSLVPTSESIIDTAINQCQLQEDSEIHSVHVQQ